MIITKMAEKHVSQIALLEKECFMTPWSEKSIREEIFMENAVFLVAEENDKVLGYGGMHLILGEGYIANIAVFKEHRNKGIGKQITNSLIELCEVSTSLEVRISNEPAIKLYESLGFVSQGIRKGYYEKPREDAIIYTKFN